MEARAILALVPRIQVQPRSPKEVETHKIQLENLYFPVVFFKSTKKSLYFSIYKANKVTTCKQNHLFFGGYPAVQVRWEAFSAVSRQPLWWLWGVPGLAFAPRAPSKSRPQNPGAKLSNFPKPTHWETRCHSPSPNAIFIKPVGVKRHQKSK